MAAASRGSFTSSSNTSKGTSQELTSSPVSQRGWGKQATKRLYTKDMFKNDPLLKSLEGKIAVGFGDYKPWQRTSIPRYGPTVRSKEAAVPKSEAPRPPSGRTTASAYSVPVASRGKVADRPFSAATQKTACSSICAHPWNRKPPPVDDAAEKRRLKRINVLLKRGRKDVWVQVKTRENSIKDYQKRRADLLKDNIFLKSQIETSENGVHNDVKELLKKYDKFRGALATLNETFEEDLVSAKKSLDTTKQKVNKETKELQHQLDLLDRKVQKKMEEMKVLLNYKDKEYPVKALAIAKLKRKKEILNVAFEEELEELQAVIDAETSKFGKGRRVAKDTITASVTEQTISSMDKSIQDMALQNMIMKKEIEIHKKEMELVDKHNAELEQEIGFLLESPEMNSKAHLFPDVFLQREKCTPDMDIVLDIPTQEWLPI